MKLRPYQVEAAQAVETAWLDGLSRVLVVLPTGCGKAQPVDEPVLTPSGWRTIGSLVPGDRVIGSRGLPVRVTGVYPQGEREMFAVRFSDGAQTVCDGEHLWQVATKSQRHRGQAPRVLTLNAIAAEGLRDGMGWRHFVPLVGAVVGHREELPLDPYLLGVLLGDGGLSVRGRVMLHTEHELVRSLASAIPAGVRLRLAAPCGTGEVAGSYAFGGPIGRTTNPVMAAVRALGLEGAKAATKFVPTSYATADAPQRLALLRGLMDADGHVRRDGLVEFTTVSSALAAGVVDIVRSLGGTARMHEKRTTWTHRGEKRFGTALRVTLQMPGDMCPFRWERKAHAWRPRPKYQPVRAIASITPVGARQAVCISVDAADRLYVTRDYVVTHNTVLFAAIAQREVEAGGRVLVLAHRTELLEQARNKLLAAGCWAEIEQAGRRAGLASVVVASVQTLRGARLEAFDRNAFTRIIIDEAHRAAAKGYRAILEWFEAAKVLGVTATGDRGDGAALGDVFERCVYRLELRPAIRDGWLAPIVCKRIEVKGVDLSAVKTTKGDLAQNELGAIMADEEALIGVADPLLREVGQRKGIVFAVDVANAHALAEVLNRYEPGCARAVDGTASADERAELLAAFRRGDFRILVNCALFTEGFDEPSIEFVAVARPTKSRALYTQMVGRGTRPISPPTADTAEERRAAIAASSKPSVLLLDFSGNAGRHRLVGPADVLAGQPVADDVKKRIDELTEEEQLEMDGLLDHVEDELAKKRAERKVTATANYVAEQIDPFIGALPEVEVHRWDNDPATERQRELLEKNGLGKLPPELTKGEASRLIEAMHQRRLRGLCSLKQARYIRRHLGIDASNMPAGEAGKLCAQITNGWSARKSARAGGGF